MASAVEELKEFLAEATELPLLGWLSAFDKNGDGKIDTEEFKTAMRELKYPGNVEELFRMVDADHSGYLTMNEIDEWSCDLWAAFRRWCGQTFACADEMVSKLSQEIGGHFHQVAGRRGSLTNFLSHQAHGPPSTPQRSPCFTESQFVRNAVRLGWYGSFEPVIFKCLDKEKVGRVTAKELTWLEQEHHLHLKRTRTKTRGGRDMAKAARSLQSFSAFLRMKFGFPFRGWRMMVDREGHMMVHRRELLKACNELGWHGDVSALWHALDPEDTGCSSLEEFSASEARCLAIFRRWAVDFHGGVKAGFRALLAGDRQRRKHRGKLDRASWLAACESEQVTFDAHWVFKLLDWEEHGSISFKEVKFVEDWTPAEWLSSDPNPEAAQDFKRLLLEKCDHYVKAWRLMIDVDSSGKVTFKEFKRAAETLKFQGDVAGAFLDFDVHGQGELTLNEIDHAAAKSLADFRRWAYAEFGGVMLAFRALDTDNSGTLSFREFRQSFSRYRFKGDITKLFHSLNIDGDGEIGKSEVSFLDDWEIDMLQMRDDQQDHLQPDIGRSGNIRRRSSTFASAAPDSEPSSLRPESTVSGAKLLQLIGWGAAAGAAQKPAKLAAVAPQPTGSPSPCGLPPGFTLAAPLPPATVRDTPSPPLPRTSWVSSSPVAWDSARSLTPPSTAVPNWAAAGAWRLGTGLCRASYRSSPSAPPAAASCSTGCRSRRAAKAQRSLEGLVPRGG